METRKKQQIGLNTYLYTFPLNSKVSFRNEMEKKRCFGTVTEVFLNNELGFELKLSKKIKL